MPKRTRRATKKADPDALMLLRHSCAHVMARAIMRIFPGVSQAFGPTKGHGFYYDFAYERSFTPEDLAAIEKKMAELAKADLEVRRRVMPRDDAVTFG